MKCSATALCRIKLKQEFEWMLIFQIKVNTWIFTHSHLFLESQSSSLIRISNVVFFIEVDCSFQFVFRCLPPTQCFQSKPVI